MIIEKFDVNAHSTIITVFKIITTSYSTKSAIVAMIGFFLAFHPKIANFTMIFSKFSVAVYTLIAKVFNEMIINIASINNEETKQKFLLYEIYLRFARLPCETLSTNNFSDFKTINFMLLRFGHICP